MLKSVKKNIIVISYLLTYMVSCKQKEVSGSGDTIQSRTPVTITSIRYEPLQEFIELNATSSFLQKSLVKSNLTGYVKKAYVKTGNYIKSGQALFVLKTKEAEAIGNSVNRLNPDFKFSGINTITANRNGFITELDHQAGDYVQEGEQLAVISDSKSFAFIMNVPYEDLPYVSIGKSVDIILPGNSHLAGLVTLAMPTMDSVSQTQSFVIKANALYTIPQNLVVTVKIVKVSKTAAATLPKSSLLSNETQSDFWVMKMINDSTAVKVAVKKGGENGDRVEITSPEFLMKDSILSGGNYGLADTALVTVQK